MRARTAREQVSCVKNGGPLCSERVHKKSIFRTRQVKKTTGPVVVRLAEMATKREREDRGLA